MPLYEYECPKCEQVHEVIQKFSGRSFGGVPDLSRAGEKTDQHLVVRPEGKRLVHDRL